MKKISIQKALADKLSGLNQPVVSEYDLAVQTHQLYSAGKYQGQPLLIKKKCPETREINNAINKLSVTGILEPLKKVRGVYKIFGKNIDSEEEVVCSINPFVYISHSSAMEYHGLTDNIPRVLIYSSPDPKTWKKLAATKMENDFKGIELEEAPHLTSISIQQFGKKKIIKHSSKHVNPGAYINIKNSALRISSIGRTFLDMIRKPELCDGIYNIIKAYEDFAEQYLDLIVDEIDRNGNKIEKVRAGYILEERCGISNNAQIENWKKEVQRGGSRKLDPNNEYMSKYSENWSLSINIEE